MNPPLPVRHRIPSRLLLASTSRAQCAVGQAEAYFNDLLRRLGAELGLDSLEFDARRCCLLDFDDVEVQLSHPGSDSLLLSGAVAVLREPVRAPLLLQLLGANLFGKDSLGGTLALDPARSALFLQARLPMPCGLPQLLQQLQALVCGIELWRARLDSSAVRPGPGHGLPPCHLTAIPGTMQTP